MGIAWAQQCPYRGTRPQQRASEVCSQACQVGPNLSSDQPSGRFAERLEAEEGCLGDLVPQRGLRQPERRRHQACSRLCLHTEVDGCFPPSTRVSVLQSEHSHRFYLCHLTPLLPPELRYSPGSPSDPPHPYFQPQRVGRGP